MHVITPKSSSAPSGSRQWLFFAIASGACAAVNGVFAKLTTTSLTATWAASLSHLFGFQERSVAFEYLVRGTFFGLNLTFDAVMWGLFTRALTLASSTVHVSVLNTSANFLVTAFAGATVFSEALPPLWFLGAAMLVLGAWVIGRREGGREDEGARKTGGGESVRDSGGDGTDGVSMALLDEGEQEEEEPDAPIAVAEERGRGSKYVDEPASEAEDEDGDGKAELKR